MRRRVVLSFLSVLLLTAGCFQTPEETGAGTGDRAVVVAQHHLAAEAGAGILRSGGNAVDAAAAVQWALNVVEPQFSGLGGGAFFVYYEAESGEVTTLDGREVAPAAATPDMHRHTAPETDPTLMGTAVGVPGTLALYDEALRRWGTLPLAATFEPAIRLAEDGWPVTELFANDLEKYRHRIESWPEAAEWLLPGSVCFPSQAGWEATGSVLQRCHGGSPPPVGTVLINPDLARTFRTIADGGLDPFYRGTIGEALVAAQAERGGRITMDDLAAYSVVERAPSVSTFRGHTLHTMDMPSSALTMQHMLALLEDDDLATSGQDSADTLHLVIEAMHLGYADRAAFMADEDHVAVPKAGLMHPDYVAKRRALIDTTKANTDVRPGDPWAYEGRQAAPGTHAEGTGSVAGPSPIAVPEEQHTSHFVIVDHDGNIASVTTTIEHYFGTGMLVPDHGFFLNNELTDFDHSPGGPNEAAPGKRPRSSMSPTIVFTDGEPILALGSPGGSTIITSVFQVLLNVLVHDLPLDEAVAAPRIYSATYPSVRWEEGIGVGVRADLEARGHDFEETSRVIGSVQAALLGPDGVWIGAHDPRRDGGTVHVPRGEVGHR